MGTETGMGTEMMISPTSYFKLKVISYLYFSKQVLPLNIYNQVWCARNYVFDILNVAYAMVHMHTSKYKQWYIYK